MGIGQKFTLLAQRKSSDTKFARLNFGDDRHRQLTMFVRAARAPLTRKSDGNPKCKNNFTVFYGQGLRIRSCIKSALAPGDSDSGIGCYNLNVGQVSLLTSSSESKRS